MPSPDCAYCNASYIGGALMHEHNCRRPLYAGALEPQGVGGTSRTATTAQFAAAYLAITKAALDGGGSTRPMGDDGLVISGTWVLTPAALMAIAQAVLDA